MTAVPETVTDRFREAFHQTRLALVRAHGPEAFDQAQVLYICRKTGKSVVIRDAFQTGAGGSAVAFIEALKLGWWAGRQTFEGEAEEGLDLQPVAGLYARYLGEVGFDYSIEFDLEGAKKAWRMNARGKVWPLVLPKDEGMFRDQMGTFFDLQAGWRFLVDQHLETGEIALAEVQSGYLVGVRAGVPGDPNPEDREDPALEAVFSKCAASAHT